MRLKRIQTFTYFCVSVSKEVNFTHANNFTYYVADLITDALFCTHSTGRLLRWTTKLIMVMVALIIIIDQMTRAI